MNRFFRPTHPGKWHGLLLLLTAAIWACGGSGGDFEQDEMNYSSTNDWERISVVQIDENGSTLPHVVARQDVDQNVHIAYYNVVTEPDETQYHRINHLVWNPRTRNLTQNTVENSPAPTGVDGFDRCDQFDFTLDDNNVPVFIYPTYETDDYLQQVEADIMVNFFEGGTWSEYTGVVGYVERNPVYQDGHVTENMSLAVDSQGDVHICYQFFTEGMDAFNFRYPDLYYAERERGTIDAAITDIQQYGNLEERVDGNAYSTYGDHNSVGYACKLLLDDQDLPIIFYAEHSETPGGQFALKMAYKNESGQWRREIIEDLPSGWRVGSISAAFYPLPDPDPDADPDADPPQRSLGVAYYVELPSPGPDNGHRLKFANNQSGAWVTEIADETTWCGDFCSLAIDSNGTPAIAYYDKESHSRRLHQYLNYAEFDGMRWKRESVDEFGNVGRYNTLWFNANDVPYICTFSDEDNEILVIRQIDN